MLEKKEVAMETRQPQRIEDLMRPLRQMLEEDNVPEPELKMAPGFGEVA